MITREEFYEILVQSMSATMFEKVMNIKPVDIQSLDYDFYRDVKWDLNLECAYNLYIND